MEKNNDSELDPPFVNVSINGSYKSYMALLFWKIKLCILIYYYLGEFDTEDADLNWEFMPAANSDTRLQLINREIKKEAGGCWLYSSELPEKCPLEAITLPVRFKGMLFRVWYGCYLRFFYLSVKMEIHSVFHHYDRLSPPDQRIKGIIALRLWGYSGKVSLYHR